ncbi:hypothetical protein H0H92_009214, partial [Tricholoma furcatifolium]
MLPSDPTCSGFLPDSPQIRRDVSAAGGNGSSRSLSEYSSNWCKMKDNVLASKNLIPEDRTLLNTLIMKNFNSMSDQIKWDSQGDGNTLRKVVAEKAVDDSW